MYQSTIPPVDIEAFSPDELIVAEDRLDIDRIDCETAIKNGKTNKLSDNDRATIARFEMTGFIFEQLARKEGVVLSREGVIHFTKQRIKDSYPPQRFNVTSEDAFRQLLLKAWSEIVVIVRV